MITWLLRATVLCVVLLLNINEAVSKPDYNNEESLLNTVTCPTLQAQYNNSPGLCEAFVVVPNPVSADPNCVIATVINSYNVTSNASDFYPVGITTVTFSVVFTNGQGTNCSVDVNVVDTEAPVLTCPTANPLVCSINEEPILQTLDEYLMEGGVVTDNCMELDTMSFTYVDDIVINPGNCPLLVDRIYQIQDMSGRIGNCTQRIVINDTTNPTITCPANINMMTSTCELFVTVPDPDTMDNCGIVSLINDYNGTDDASDTYPVGTTMVTFTATDGCGNTSTCSFNVVITEDEDPMAICQDVNVILDNNGDGVLDPSDVNNNSTDNCDMDLELSLSRTTFSCMDVGTPVVVVLTVTDDSGNTDTCESTVTILDEMAPVIICPQDINDECGSVTAAYADLAEFQAANGVATDNCDIASFDLQSEVSNGMTCPETLTRTYVVTDPSGMTSTCTQIVIINDTTAPTFTVPADMTIECDESTLPANTGSPTNIMDACTGSGSFTVGSTDNVASGACINEEIITRTWSVTDLCNNTATDVQTITVVDTSAPDITTGASDLNVECDGQGNSAELTAWLASNGGAVAMDNCSSTINWSNDFTALTNGCAATGSALVIFTATDDCGLSATTSASFTIEDNIAPTLVGVPPAPLPNIACSDDFPQFNVTAIDGCGTAIVETDTTYDESMLCDPGAIGYFVSYDWVPVDECGNRGAGVQRSFWVLRDDEPPVFTSPNECLGLISPSSVSSPNFTISTGFNIDGMINGSGLSSYDLNATHGGPDGNAWEANEEMGQLNFDLGSVQDISGMAIWNGSEHGGVKDIEVFYSTDGINYAPIPDSPEQVQAAPAPSTAEVFSFPSVSASHIRIEVLSTWFAPMQAGINEIIFITGGLREIPTDLGTCTFTGVIDPPSIMDNCTMVEMSNNITGTAPLQGMYMAETVLDVTWTATDECGNVSTCEQRITIVDEEAPVCNTDGSSTVSLNGSGFGSMQVADFDPTATDNCTDPKFIWFFVERVTDNCMNPDNLVPDQEVTFCCADIGTTVMVSVTAMDLAGNISAPCMVAVTVNDFLAPTIVRPLPDVTISCDVEFMDVMEFGTYVDDPLLAQEYMFDGNPNYFDGLVSDNCEIDTVTYTIVEDLECDHGTITKEFEITDVSGRITTATQVITIEIQDTFKLEDIMWPANFTITSGCVTSSPPSSLTGEPIINEKNCSMIGVSKKDVIFDDPFSGCPLIKRTWRVMDWCQYDPNSGSDDGVWEYEQSIFVENSNMPDIVCPNEHTVCTNEATCLGAINLKVTATDDCTNPKDIIYTYEVDEGNNGTVDFSGVGDSIPGVFPSGEYRIHWYANDRCGNVATCATLLTVRDCKNPLAVCMNGLSIDLNEMPVMGIVAVVWASDFNVGSSDNCTDQDKLIYSFSENVDSTNMVLSCDNLGRNDVEMWVTDEAGNQSHCNTFIIVQDNKELCPAVGPRISIEGKVRSYSDEVLEEVKIDLESQENVTIELTDDEGSYAFRDLEMYQDYKLKPSMEDDYLNGVSTLDLVLIQRHILGLALLDSPYKIIAADANGTNNVDAIDLITIRKLILGIYDDLDKTPSWRFIDAMQDFPDQLQPWGYKSNMTMFDLDYNAKNMNFVGVKTADVNGTAIVKINGEQSENRNKHYAIDVINRGSIVEFVANENIKTYGLQLSIDGFSNSDVLRSGIFDVVDENYHFENDVLNLSWNSSKPVEVNKGMVLFSIDRSSDNDIRLESDYLNAEIYNESYEIRNIELTNRNSTILGEFEVIAISPNPFTDYARIDLSVPKEGVVNVELVSFDGKILYATERVMMSGNNSITVDKDQLGDYKGVIYCTINYGNSSIHRTVIRM